MLTKLKQLTDSEGEITVELNKDELREYLEKAGKSISQFIQIDGFRSGKAPLDVLRRKVGDQKILEEALEFAVTDSLAKALQREKVEIISSSNLKVIENTSELLKYSIELLVFPEVRIGTYKNLGISAKQVEAEDKEIDQALDRILRSKAILKDSEEPARKGNHLEIDFEAATNGQVLEGGKSQDHPFVLGEGNFIPGFEDQLAGVRKNDTKEFSLIAPADYYQKSIAGKKLDFKVTVKAIKTKNLPELNDEFARSLGDFQSLEELKKSIGDGLRAEKEQKERERTRLKILEKIGEQTEIKIPTKLIEQQLNEMVADFDENLHQRGMELGLYLAHIKKTQEDLRKEWKEQAEKQIRQSLILREIGRRENIRVGEEEIEQAVGGLLAQITLTDQRKPDLDMEKIKQRTEDALWRQKVFEFLEEQNK